MHEIHGHDDDSRPDRPQGGREPRKVARYEAGSRVQEDESQQNQKTLQRLDVTVWPRSRR